MCKTCGCGDHDGVRVTDMQTGETKVLDVGHAGHAHDHSHDHGHGAHTHRHDHPHEAHTHHHDHGATTIHLQQAILARNDALAERNRGWFAGRNILALNLVSSPGAGKTTLLERTIKDLAGTMPMHVVEGDQETANDAQRIRAAGCRVVQINTGAGCHLDAAMVAHGLAHLDPPPESVLMIENVGNLVCPALFDLGEHAKVLIVSVTEGEDKPVKYPHMFRASQLLLLNKIDLLPHVAFDVNRFEAHARAVNPHLEILQISAIRGDGMTGWYDWLQARRVQRHAVADGRV
jgi:hydrogenase nickel incorporation protein HypB